MDDEGGLEQGECLAEVILPREEARTVMGRVAYSINQVADDLEGFELNPQHPLPGDSGEDASNEASDSRPGLTSVEPSPGASRSEASSSSGIQGHIDRAKEIVTVHADSSDEEPSATVTAAKMGRSTSLETDDAT